MSFLTDPTEIERESMERIEAIVPGAKKTIFPPPQWEIVRRVIHTTGDPGFLEIMRFSEDAVERGVQALTEKKTVICDTHMLLSGIGTGRLKRLGVEASCLIRDEETRRRAEHRGETRAAAAVDVALERFMGEIGVFAIGNAPTALLRLIDRVSSGGVQVDLVVGTPVGFVSAAESKALLMGSGIPYISCTGTRGGSAVAAAIVNALAIMALSEGEHKEDGANH